MKKLLAIFLILILSLCGCAEEAAPAVRAETLGIDDVLSLLSADKPLVKFEIGGAYVGVFLAMNDEEDLVLSYKPLSEYPMTVRLDSDEVYVHETRHSFGFDGAIFELGELSFELYGADTPVMIGENADGAEALVTESGEVYALLDEVNVIQVEAMHLTIGMDIFAEAVSYAWEFQELIPLLRPTEEDVKLLDKALTLLRGRLYYAGLSLRSHDTGAGGYYSFRFDPAQIHLALMGFADDFLSHEAEIDAVIGHYAPAAAELLGDAYLFYDEAADEDVYLSNLSAAHLKSAWSSAERELLDYEDVPVLNVQFSEAVDGGAYLDAFVSAEAGESNAMLNVVFDGDGVFEGTLRVSDYWDELYVFDVEGSLNLNHFRLVVTPREAMDDFTGLMFNAYGGNEIRWNLAFDGISVNLYSAGGLIEASLTAYNEAILNFSLDTSAMEFEIVMADYWDYQKIALEDGTLVIYQ